MAPVLRVDEEVWAWLKTHATPLEDTPNSVLRKLAGLDEKPANKERPRFPEANPKESSMRNRDARPTLLDPFVRRLEEHLAKRGGDASVWKVKDRKSSRNILKVTPGRGESPILLYIKTRSDSGGFWGLTKNRLNALVDSGENWLVVLLIGPGEKGYVLSPSAIETATSQDRWSFGKAGDYKVHENHELNSAAEFSDWAALISAVLQERGANKRVKSDAQNTQTGV